MKQILYVFSFYIICVCVENARFSTQWSSAVTAVAIARYLFGLMTGFVCSDGHDHDDDHSLLFYDVSPFHTIV